MLLTIVPSSRAKARKFACSVLGRYADPEALSDLVDGLAVVVEVDDLPTEEHAAGFLASIANDLHSLACGVDVVLHQSSAATRTTGRYSCETGDVAVKLSEETKYVSLGKEDNSAEYGRVP